MSYPGPENPLESYAIPDLINVVYQGVQATQAVLAQLKSMAGVTSGGGGGYPAVFSLPTNYSNFMEILVAGGIAQGYTNTDYVVVPASESASLTITVSPNDVLAFTGATGIIDSAAPHNTGFLATISINGTDFVPDAAMLGDLQYDGAYVPPVNAGSNITFTYQNTSSASITGAYQVQGALVNANTWTTQLLPTLQGQAKQLLQDGSSLLP